MWSKDSYLRQLPHFTKELIDKCVEKVILSFCFLGMSLTYALREWKVFSTSWSWRTRRGTSCSTWTTPRWQTLPGKQFLSWRYVINKTPQVLQSVPQHRIGLRGAWEGKPREWKACQYWGIFWNWEEGAFGLPSWEESEWLKLFSRWSWSVRTKLPDQSLLHSSRPRERRAGQWQFKIKRKIYCYSVLAPGGLSSGTRRPTPCCRSSVSRFSRKQSSSWTLLHLGLESTGQLLRRHQVFFFCSLDLALIICCLQLLALLHVRLLHGLRPGVQVQLGDWGGW